MTLGADDRLVAEIGEAIRLDIVAARIAEISAAYRVRMQAYDRYAYCRFNNGRSAPSSAIRSTRRWCSTNSLIRFPTTLAACRSEYNTLWRHFAPRMLIAGRISH